MVVNGLGSSWPPSWACPGGSPRRYQVGADFPDGGGPRARQARRDAAALGTARLEPGRAPPRGGRGPRGRGADRLHRASEPRGPRRPGAGAGLRAAEAARADARPRCPPGAGIGTGAASGTVAGAEQRPPRPRARRSRAIGADRLRRCAAA
ncbi:hypothetical protein QJS66_07380 [Kocuria rhizophila]|nr:hypothetical protein QJS66_07380 [Kocuria rhizophila]